MSSPIFKAANCDSKPRLLAVALIVNELMDIFKSGSVKPTPSSHFRQVFSLPGSLSSQWLQNCGVWNSFQMSWGCLFIQHHERQGAINQGVLSSPSENKVAATNENSSSFSGPRRTEVTFVKVTDHFRVQSPCFKNGNNKNKYSSYLTAQQYVLGKKKM